ncbi:max-binding protein MNT-like [Cavia porcellus]|uniref:max-binding protein MNT-like n=1 Tax=Cavia porcellus TaxID=10141 RepID=UPI002FE3268A
MWLKGLLGVSRILATSPVHPAARLHLAGGRWGFGGVSAQEPHPFPPPAPLPSRALPSSYPHLSSSRSPPPRACLPLPPPHPWEAPPVGQRCLISGFPARGRQRLVGGSSAVRGRRAQNQVSLRGPDAPATARLAPALPAAALRVPRRTRPRPTRALRRLFQDPAR